MRAQLCLGPRESLLIVSNGNVLQDSTEHVYAPAWSARKLATEWLEGQGYIVGEWERHDGYLLAGITPR